MKHLGVYDIALKLAVNHIDVDDAWWGISYGKFELQVKISRGLSERRDLGDIGEAIHRRLPTSSTSV
jgi:hypothetical protein